MITRSPKTIYNDNITGGINLNNNDRFVLDGNRLIATSGNYGENGTTYRTETETFSQITSMGTAGDGPEKFLVQTKEGMTLEYGYTANSKFVKQGSSTIIFWRVNKVYDNHGNYTEFKYINDNYESRIDEILYTGNINNGEQPYNKLKFIYDLRDDKNTIYSAGATINSNIILRKIEIICEEKKIKSYEFKYFLEVYTYLNEIIENGNDGSQLNSTILNYGDEGTFSSPNTTIPISGSGAEYWIVDYNGDGKSDLVQLVWDVIGCINCDKVWTEWNLFRNNGDNTFTSVFEDPQSFPESFQPIGDFYPLNKGLTGNMITVNLDFNGDGFEDLIFVTGNSDGLYSLYPYQYNGSTFEPQSTFNIERTTTLRYLDFDGDQRMDVFTHNFDEGNSMSYSINVRLNGNFTQPTTLSISSDYKFNNAYPIDIDGDGRTELANVFNTNTFTYHILKYNTSNQLILESQPDFDGFSNAVTKFFGDFNGDGKSDIIEINETQLDVFISNGFSFTKYSNTISGWSIDVPNDAVLNDISDEIDFGDFDGDGDMEIFVNKNGWQEPKHIIYLGFSPSKGLVHEISDGYNNKTSIQYAPLTQDGDFYTKGTSSLQEYPISDYQGPLHAVSSVTISDGIGGTRQTDYKYEGAKIHKQGKGFLSFSKIITLDNTAGIKSEVNYSQIPNISPIVAHSVSDAKTIATSDNSIISESTITNSAKTYGDNSFFPFVEQSVVVNNLKGQTITGNFTYNNDGNLTNSTVNYGTAETESSTYTYIQKGSHIPNRIETQTITKTRDGDIYTISNFYDYFSEGKLKEQKVFNGLAKEITTQYAYNSIGNLISTTVTSPGLASRTTTINKYDDRGRFPIKITNPLGQISEAQYDSRWGTPLMQKGADGLITTYQYDAFGKLIKTKSPDNIETNYSYAFVTSAMTDPLGNSIPALYSSSVQRNGSPSSTTFYDIYGRTLKTHTEGLAATKNFNTVQSYNSNGQLFKKFLSFFDNETSESFTTYTYFNTGLKTGLPHEIDNTLAGTTSYNYSTSGGLFTSSATNPAGQTVSQKTDASEKIVEATDNGGTLNYNYYGHGQLKEVTQGGNQLAFIEYDDYARQKKLKDPNADEIEYTYNAFGELEYQKDKLGNVYKMLYDQLSRIISKQCTTCTGTDANQTTWQYFSSGTAINQLQSVTAPNGISQQYSYDNLGRLTSLNETIENTPFITQYSYDQFSNISQIAYPSGFKIARTYDKGYLTEVKNASTNASIWSDPVLNSSGQHTAYKNGTVQVTKDFHPLGMLQNYQAGSGGSIHDMTFNWNDQTGNLNSREDVANNGITEHFDYDNLNRLTSSVTQIGGMGGIPQNQINISYYPNGNIQNKTRIGGYSYNSAGQINAVETVGNNIGDISSQTQDITYTPFNKTATVTEENKVLNLTYGADNQRRISELIDNGTTTRKTIYSGNYEKVTVKVDGVDKTYHVHYIAAGPGLVAINVRNNNIDELFYVYTDHLGSIVKLTDASGNIVYEQNFDAWGRERNPTDWSYSDNTNSKPEWLLRGFTGHEHLTEFALINMNGRVYDPLLGRFNSPDNFVQDATSTQGYNRYSYALNNPLTYTDPDGNFVIADSWIVGFISGFFSTGSHRGSAAWNEANLRAWNDVKIWGGLFISDPNKNFGGRVWETVSRFTFQLPQTLGGFLTAHTYNTVGLQGGVGSVKYKYGATVIKTRKHAGGQAVTQGSYIIGDKTIEADANNPLFQHEYGHYIQSQRWGYSYYGVVGIPSIRSEHGNYQKNYRSHNFHPVEQDANRRAFLYFNKNVEGFQDDADRYDDRGWDFGSNPLDVNKTGRGVYIDYGNSNDLQLLNNLKVKAHWYDYTFPIVSGFYNAYQYNH